MEVVGRSYGLPVFQKEVRPTVVAEAWVHRSWMGKVKEVTKPPNLPSEIF